MAPWEVTCEDNTDKCSSWEAMCDSQDPTYASFMEKQCPKTCKKCNPSSSKLL